MSEVLNNSNVLISELTNNLNAIQKFSKQFDLTGKDFKQSADVYSNYLVNGEAFTLNSDILGVNKETLYWMQKNSIATDFYYMVLMQGGKDYLKGYEQRIFRNGKDDKAESEGFVYVTSFSDPTEVDYGNLVQYDDLSKQITTEFITIDLEAKTVEANRLFFKEHINDSSIKIISRMASALAEGFKALGYEVDLYELEDSQPFTIEIDKSIQGMSFEDAKYGVLDDLMLTMSASNESGIIKEVGKDTVATTLKGNTLQLEFEDKGSIVGITLIYTYNDGESFYAKLMQYPDLNDWYYTLFNK